MKPFGEYFSREGCTCALCRSRGYRKNDAYDASNRVCKKRARQTANREIKREIEINSK